MTQNDFKLSANNRSCLIIINPRSGTRHKGRVIKHAVEAMLNAGWNVETRMTEAAGHATELAARAAADGVEAVVAMGGDGTVNETARALCNTSSTLGIIPMGSGNGLARHLNIPMEPLEAIKVIARGKQQECDYCTVNNKPFFCTFGMGFDAAVSNRFASRPDQRGLINYLRAGIEEFVGYRSEEYVISADNETLTEKAFVIACCNAAQYGNNAFIAPKASVTDGLMDVTVLHSGTWLSQALNGIDMLIGAIHNGARARTFQTRHVTIRRSKPGPVHIDGDPAIMGTRLEVRCHHHGITVFTPGEMVVTPVLTPLGINPLKKG